MIPVYIFTGFLDSGKSTFINTMLEDPDFNDGERTLLIRCEEGEVEYETIRFAGAENVELVVLEGKEQLTEAYLSELDVCGVWIDDDFRMGNHTQSCWCDSCIAEFSARQGRDYTREELVRLVNDDFDTRDAWIKFTSDRAHDAAKLFAAVSALSQA